MFFFRSSRLFGEEIQMYEENKVRFGIRTFLFDILLIPTIKIRNVTTSFTISLYFLTFSFGMVIFKMIESKKELIKDDELLDINIPTVKVKVTHKTKYFWKL